MESMQWEVACAVMYVPNGLIGMAGKHKKLLQWLEEKRNDKLVNLS